MGQAEEIKQKIDIVELIREYVPVKAVGANFQAVCPFHNEKTPSFVISPDKQIWHCFGCGRGGDAFAFVMEKEGISFIEALRHLAPKAGVTLKYEDAAQYSKRNRLLDIMELAAKYYAHMLSQPQGKAAREYLDKRGLSQKTIEDWQIGYSPESWDSLYKFLLARPLTGKKYTDEEILAAGLITRKEGGRGYYDRFRDRIMFPIRDLAGHVIAFTARINPAKEATEKMGKYINSPQTDIYDKSRVLFGLNKAKGAMRQADLAIVVEGQMDAISCHAHGYENVVASSGTALTTEQVKLIKRFTDKVALSFDMDAAGQMAADRGIKEVLAHDLKLKVIVLPQGKDPDECLRKDPNGFSEAVANAKPMLEYYYDKISAGLDLSKLDNKMKVRDQMFVMIDLVQKPTEQGYWLKALAESLGFQEDDLRQEFGEWRAKQKRPQAQDALKKTAPAQSAKASREDRLGELLLAIAIKFPDHLGYLTSNLEPEALSPEEASSFYKNLIIYYNRTGSLDYESFRIYLEEEAPGEERLLDKLILLGEKDFYSFTTDQAKAELIKIIVELRKSHCKVRIKDLEKRIAAAEKAERSEELEMLMSELKNLTDELNAINIG